MVLCEIVCYLTQCGATRWYCGLVCSSLVAELRVIVSLFNLMFRLEIQDFSECEKNR